MKYILAILLIFCLASCKKERTLTHLTLKNVGDTAIDTLLTVDSLNFVTQKETAKLLKLLHNKPLMNIIRQRIY